MLVLFCSACAGASANARALVLALVLPPATAPAQARALVVALEISGKVGHGRGSGEGAPRVFELKTLCVEKADYQGPENQVLTTETTLANLTTAPPNQQSLAIRNLEHTCVKSGSSGPQQQNRKFVVQPFRTLSFVQNRLIG